MDQQEDGFPGQMEDIYAFRLTVPVSGDADGDRRIDGTDYTLWADHYTGFGQKSWSSARAAPAAERAALLEKAADGLEARKAELVSLIVREGGRTYHDAVSEVREAADFCRYYALQARRVFARTLVPPGPAGERNELRMHGRGVFACISPWNFPLAIFTGQIAAALAAGNTVVAKPA